MRWKREQKKQADDKSKEMQKFWSRNFPSMEFLCPLDKKYKEHNNTAKKKLQTRRTINSNPIHACISNFAFKHRHISRYAGLHSGGDDAHLRRDVT